MPDYLSSSSVEGNILQQIDELKRRLAALENGDIQAQQLSELTDNMGDIRAGRFIALSTGQEPTDADASGCFVSADAETFSQGDFNIGGVNNGVLQFGVDAQTGKAIFAAGETELGEDGIVSFAEGIAHQQITGAANYRTHLGALLPRGLSLHSGYLESFNGFEESASLVTNYSFETGDLTGWALSGGAGLTLTVTDDTNYVNSQPPYFEGSYGLQVSGTTASTGFVSSNTFNVTGGARYFVEAFLKYLTGSSTGDSLYTCYIRWYDAGANLLASDVFGVLSIQAEEAEFSRKAGMFIAPMAATTALIDFAFAPMGAVDLAIDDVYVIAITSGSKLELIPSAALIQAPMIQVTETNSHPAPLADRLGLYPDEKRWKQINEDGTVKTIATTDDTFTEANLSLSDVTTADVSTSAHGFTPKAPNNTTQFLRADATWATPVVPILGNEGALVYRNATQTFNLSANITWNTAYYNDNNLFWNAANGDRLVAPTGGRYMFGIDIQGTANILIYVTFEHYNSEGVLQNRFSRHKHPAGETGAMMSVVSPPIAMLTNDYTVVTLGAAAAFTSSAASAATTAYNCGWILRIK